MTHYRSSQQNDRFARYRGVALGALIVVAIPFVTTLGALVTTDRHIVTEDEAITEDQYVTAVTSEIEGTIDGDLTIFSGSVTISGEVTGDVTAFTSGTVTITPTGRIGGSLDGAALALSLQGDVGGDVFFAAGSIVVEPGADVGRDVMAFGGSTRIEGVVGRDVRGRAVRMAVDGRVLRDVDVATPGLSIGPTAWISGDVLYRSSSDADVSEDAVIVGTITKLPAQGNFVYGIIISLANVVGFLGLVVAGLIVLGVLRGVGSRATGAVLTKPIRTLLAGIAAVIVLPVAIAVTAITLVGIPIAIILIALGIVAFIVGPVPAVTALGNLALLRRGGLFGAFLAGAVLWRLGIWLIPVVGGVIYLVGLVWGIGGWVLGALAARSGDPTPAALLPAAVVAGGDQPPEWVPPRAPSAMGDVETAWADDLDEAGTIDGGTELPLDDGEGSDPNPAIQRDLSEADAKVTFDDGGAVVSEESSAKESSAKESSAEGPADDATSLEEKLAEFRSELEATADTEPGEVEATADTEPGEVDETAERFQALREELEESGTVEAPAPKPDPFEPDSDDGDSDWGLPRR